MTTGGTAQSTRSKIITDVDYGRSGKQVTHLRVPQARNSSAWGTIGIPIIVIKNGEGPTFLLTGGTHGDEYEGPIALMNMARELEADEVRGRLIIIPSLHMPAARIGTRLSPIDNKDLNRCFPGDAGGSFAQVLAHYVSSVLLPLTDYNIDIHSGGASMDCALSTTSHVLDDAGRMQSTLELAEVFGAPYHVVIKEVDAGHTFMTTAERMGIIAISSEVGGANRVSIPGTELAEAGLRRVLVHFGVIGGEAPETRRTQQMVTVPDYSCYAFAPGPGVFRPSDALESPVRAGASAGLIYAIENPTAEPVTVPYGHDGVLWCTRGPGRVEEGDVVAVVITPYQP